MTTNDNDQKYGTNRHIWRHVYGYTRRKPRIISVTDRNVYTGVTASLPRSVDINKIFRHRDYFKLQSPVSGSFLDLPIRADYEEGLVLFENETEVIANFQNPFVRGTPYVVYSVEPTDNSSSNINVFGVNSPSHSTMRIGVSAPFSGAIRYRACLAESWPYTFPIGSTPYTGSALEIYAGEYDLVNGATDYTASFNLESGENFVYRDTLFDSIGDSSMDVNTAVVTSSNTQAISTLSAPTTNRIHFIATRIIP